MLYFRKFVALINRSAHNCHVSLGTAGATFTVLVKYIVQVAQSGNSMYLGSGIVGVAAAI
jgi:hypothetical protein